MILDFGGGFFLRHAETRDHADLAMVCLKTGNAGADATLREDDPELLGLLYAIPYQIFEPDLAFAVEGTLGVCGYLFGALDTVAFNVRLASYWYPDLQRRIGDPGSDQTVWLGSDWARRLIHHPDRGVPEALAPYPSHGHIDLLPEARGKGIGTHAMQFLAQRLTGAGSPGMHLQVDPANRDALRFYDRLGFRKVEGDGLPGSVTFVAKHLSRPR